MKKAWIFFLLCVLVCTGAAAEEWACETCGSRESMNFCTQCGQPRVRVCAACGYETRGAAHFCVQCGKALGQKTELNIGDQVFFGRYEQDGNTENGKEPIRWVVMNKEEGRVLLFAVNVLDFQPYHTVNQTCTWEESHLRTWLNTYFLEEAFGANERNFVDMGRENKDADHVTLLSYEDTPDLQGLGLGTVFIPENYVYCEDYLQSGVENFEYAPATAYARMKGEEAEEYWWEKNGSAKENDPQTGCFYAKEPFLRYGVRPACWVHADAFGAEDVVEETMPAQAGSEEIFGSSRVCLIGDQTYFVHQWDVYQITDEAKWPGLVLRDENSYDQLLAYDEKLYCGGKRYTDEGPELFVLEYDLQQKETEMLLAMPLGVDEVDTFANMVGFSMDDDELFFAVQTDIYGESSYSAKLDIYQMLLGDGAIRLMCTLPEEYMILYDSGIYTKDNKVYLAVDDDNSIMNRMLEVDARTDEIREIISWFGYYSDSFFCVDDYAVIGAPDGPFYCKLDGTEKTKILSIEEPSRVSMTGKKVVFTLSDVYTHDNDGDYVYNKDIYVYDLDTGSLNKIHEGFCDIIGVCDEFIYFYDESALEKTKDFDAYSWEEKPCRIRLDGTGLKDISYPFW